MKHRLTSFKTATKLKRKLPKDTKMESIPFMKTSSLVEDIHTRTREALRKTDFDTQEYLKIDKVLQTMQGKMLNNASKHGQKK